MPALTLRQTARGAGPLGQALRRLRIISLALRPQPLRLQIRLPTILSRQPPIRVVRRATAVTAGAMLRARPRPPTKPRPLLLTARHRPLLQVDRLPALVLAPAAGTLNGDGLRRQRPSETTARLPCRVGTPRPRLAPPDTPMLDMSASAAVPPRVATRVLWDRTRTLGPPTRVQLTARLETAPRVGAPTRELISGQTRHAAAYRRPHKAPTSITRRART